MAIPTPMIISDTKITAKSMVSHQGIRCVGLVMALQSLYLPHLGEKECWLL